MRDGVRSWVEAQEGDWVLIGREDQRPPGTLDCNRVCPLLQQ